MIGLRGGGGGCNWSGCNVRIRLRPRLLPTAFTAYCREGGGGVLVGGPRAAEFVHSTRTARTMHPTPQSTCNKSVDGIIPDHNSDQLQASKS